jgi:hypothetical protein
MVQVVSRRPLTTETQVRARMSRIWIRVEQNGTGTDISPSSSVFPVNIIPPWISILVYHRGD